MRLKLWASTSKRIPMCAASGATLPSRMKSKKSTRNPRQQLAFASNRSPWMRSRRCGDARRQLLRLRMNSHHPDEVHPSELSKKNAAALGI